MFVGYDEDEVHEVLCIVSDMSCQLENIQLLYEVVVLDIIMFALKTEELDELVILLILQRVDEDEVVIVDNDEVLVVQQAIHEHGRSVKEHDDDEVLVVIDVHEQIHIQILYVDEMDEIELHIQQSEVVKTMLDDEDDDDIVTDELIVMVDEDEVEVVCEMLHLRLLVEVEVEVLVMLQYLVLEHEDYSYLGIQQPVDIT